MTDVVTRVDPIELVNDESFGEISLQMERFVTASELVKQFGGYQEFTIPMKGKQLHQAAAPLRELMMCYITIVQMQDSQLVKATDFPWSAGTQPTSDGNSEFLIFLPKGYHVLFNRSEFFSALQNMLNNSDE